MKKIILPAIFLAWTFAFKKIYIEKEIKKIYDNSRFYTEYLDDCSEHSIIKHLSLYELDKYYVKFDPE